MLDDFHQPSMVDGIEESTDVRVEYPVPSIYSSARTELAKLLIYGLFRKIRVLAQDGIRSAPAGTSVHTLEAAIWSVARTGDFRSAVLLAANLADDADTVAAVTGQLAGALYGLNAIPDHWRERVAWKDRLLAAARRLLSELLADR